MVYIHFPSNLTEEELMLQAKYQKLKKKVYFSEQIFHENFYQSHYSFGYLLT
jgi:hypothetical protein